jgi:hypothetical protein
MESYWGRAAFESALPQTPSLKTLIGVFSNSAAIEEELV